MSSSERLDKQLLDLREMESTLSAIHVSMNALIAERDALQARIDAGVRVWGTENKPYWYTYQSLVDTRTALLIDASPIDQPDAAMVDERTGKADRKGC